MRRSGQFITHFTLFVAIASAAIILAGCASPAGIAPSSHPIGLTDVVREPAPPIAVDDTWWKALGDDRLNNLVDRALASSPDLATVRTRVERAAAGVQAADAARAPQVDASLAATRQHYSAHGALPPALAGHDLNSGSLGATGQWELDVFGKQRSALDAAIGAERAAQAEYQAARVLLASNIVRSYAQLARLGDQRDIIERSLAQRQEIFSLTRQRVAAGLDTNVELRQAEGSVPEARATLAAIDEQRDHLRHALATLAALGPDACDNWSPRLSKAVLVDLPAAIPADLLGRRADITAARWRVESASSEFKAARAQFYPSVNLIAFAGFTSVGLDSLLEAGSRQYGIGPAIRLPIFDAGRLRAGYKAKASDVDGAIESYNAAVLRALHEVADATSSVQSIERQQREQSLALASAEGAYELALQRFRAGLGSYLSVLTAETNVLAQRRADNDLKARALDSQALLAHALGGGYART